MTGEVLPELVALHAAAFVAAPLAGAPGSTPALAPAAASAGELLLGLGEERQFLLSYELGSTVLRDAGLCLPAAVDGATATGHLMALALRHRQLSQAPAGGLPGQKAVARASACRRGSARAAGRAWLREGPSLNTTGLTLTLTLALPLLLRPLQRTRATWTCRPPAWRRRFLCSGPCRRCRCVTCPWQAAQCWLTPLPFVNAPCAAW